jgi:hypothetical protein
LLSDVGNVHELAGLLTAAAYSALCLGSEHDAADYAARATPTTRALDNPYAQMINRGNLGLAALLTGEPDTRYGIDAWNAGAHTGGALSFDDAIAYALEALPV